jgi:hypothetical protein
VTPGRGESVAFRLWPPVAIAAPLLVGWLATLGWGDPFDLGGWRLPLGWALVLLFLVWNGWSLWLFRRHKTGLLPGQPTRAMIEEGPYRLSRNPLYVGLLVLYVGVALLAVMDRRYGRSTSAASPYPSSHSRAIDSVLVEELRGDMTSKSDFSEDEWAQVVRAPFVAGLAVSLSDPGGPIEAGKEQMAAMRGAMKPPSREELLADVALDVQAMTQERKHPLKGYRPPGGGDPREALLEELRATRAVIEAKATPAEATAFSRWVVDVAQAAADAAKEGGFMGIGATRVSDREQSMLDRVRETLTG